MQLDILMIEDEPNIAEAVCFILSREGWKVDLHADGAGGIEAIRTARPRLVILDLMLPNRSGTEILQDLRSADNTDLATTPVLMLTARGQMNAGPPNTGQTSRGQTNAGQADAMLAKPFDNDDLRALVRRMLA